ncbi:RimK family protein [Desulfogranum japonicum]|uniref:RimK family protein n=1 Tax=Desulfogranum japonicum TaxID=231447 RepID=UPI0004249550|nr:RimK family protein [Desulfogranum japonicum]
MQSATRGETAIPDCPPTLKNVFLVIDSLDLWAPYYSSDRVTTATTYLQNEKLSAEPHLVINLCSDLHYLSEGYYCSLLAQARKHKILPSIETLNKLDRKSPVRLDTPVPVMTNGQNSLPESDTSEEYVLDLYFGKPENPAFSKIARAIFEQYPAPLLRVCFNLKRPHHITDIRPLTLKELDDHQQDLFADNLDRFNKKVWRKPKEKKPARYDIAIFHDPGESMPPSNRRALNLFISEARKMGLNAELLTEEDASRLLEFDALFIRQTTAVDNITYKLAVEAEQADMVVIDDPSSIIRCTNKVYLKELLDNKSIPTPRSKLLFCKNPPSFDEVASFLGEKMVLKIPDGSFSIGIHKVETEQQFNAKIKELAQHSSVLLAQEFLPTEYDWRIGVLNGESIFACKYFMARGHWQIYRHSSNGNVQSGKCETIPVHLVPRCITKLAEKSSGTIGKGFYGVDLKETRQGLKVIEINDNPSVDHGVEDRILGAELYKIILREITQRLDTKRSF